jgi:diguanylate cyclase (GGDEF)-like protein/PAS domain S-box-containing protein
MKEPNKLIELKGQTAPSHAGFYQELLDHISDGVYFVDRDRRIQYWSKGAQRLTGYSAEEQVGKQCHQTRLGHMDLAGNNMCVKECPLALSMADGIAHEASLFLTNKRGRKVPIAVRVQPIKGADGAVVGALEIFSDDTLHSEARRKIESMRRLAFLDHLTQLPNRRYLETQLASALAEFQVTRIPFGILLIDLDEFKAINDGFGHMVGDHVLCHVGQTLSDSLRPSDTLGRWGGDEFLAVVRDVDAETLAMLAKRSVRLVAQAAFHFEPELSLPELKIPERKIPKQSITLSVSIGSALSGPGDSAEDLVKRADELMYRSKAAGRGRATTA